METNLQSWCCDCCKRGSTKYWLWRGEKHTQFSYNQLKNEINFHIVKQQTREKAIGVNTFTTHRLKPSGHRKTPQTRIRKSWTNPLRSPPEDSFLLSVCGQEQTSHCTDLPKHPTEHKHTQHQYKIQPRCSATLLSRPQAYQVKFLHSLTHGPFWIAGAHNWRRAAMGEKGRKGKLINS